MEYAQAAIKITPVIHEGTTPTHYTPVASQLGSGAIPRTQRPLPRDVGKPANCPYGVFKSTTSGIAIGAGAGAGLRDDKVQLIAMLAYLSYPDIFPLDAARLAELQALAAEVMG